MKTEIILVDEKDNAIGTGEKLAVHEQGLLHRAFSVYIFNSQGQIMLQQRAASKYHSPGLWTNACCGHPYPGEDIETAVHRRLQEEMGFDCDFTKLHTLTYKAKFDNGLTEHEFLHIFAGIYNGDPNANPEEADSWKWADIPSLQQDMQSHPEAYTYWFSLCLPEVIAGLEK